MPQSRLASRAWSARTQLAVLVAAILTPVLVFSGILAWVYADRERERYETQVRVLAGDILAAVDREFAGVEASVQALSTSRSLKRGDFATVYAQANEAKAFNGTNVTVRDLTGQQLLNTRIPFGTPLPRTSTEPDRLAAEARRPAISDLFVGATTREPLFVITAPVFREGGEDIVSFINMSLPTERVAALIAEENVPPGWTAAVLDRKGVIVARYPGQGEFVGRSATERFLQTATAAHGFYEGENLEGVPVLTAYAKSARFGWMVTTSVPRSVLTAPLRRSLLLLSALGGGLTLLSALLALWFGRRIALPIQGLARQASALGRGQDALAARTTLFEVNQVGAEIEDAARARSKAEAALAEAGQAQARLNVALAAQADELRESNEEMQRYAYIVSHDLRAPLVNVMGFTSEIEATQGDVRVALAGNPRGADIDRDLGEALGFIRAAVNKMEGLIAAILKLSRDGRRRLAPEPLAMTPLVQALANAIRHQTEQADATIAIAPDLPGIEADRLGIEGVFGNLLDNAVKYLLPGRPGRISVTGEVQGSQAIYRVADNGRGIAAADRTRVFELFRRAGQQDRPGEGIGLAQVKATVRALGGRIDLTSQPGEGSTFTVTLPRQASTDASKSSRVA